MKHYLQLAVLVLVMLGGLFSLDYAYNFHSQAVFGQPITGAQVYDEECDEEGYAELYPEDCGGGDYSPQPDCSCSSSGVLWACSCGGTANTRFQCQATCVPGGISGSQEPSAATGSTLSCTPGECVEGVECFSYDNNCEAQQDNSCCTTSPEPSEPTTTEEICRPEGGRWICIQNGQITANTKFQCQAVCRTAEPSEEQPGEADEEPEEVETIPPGDLVDGTDLRVEIVKYPETVYVRDSPFLTRGERYEIVIDIHNFGKVSTSDSPTAKQVDNLGGFTSVISVGGSSTWFTLSIRSDTGPSKLGPKGLEGGQSAQGLTFLWRPSEELSADEYIISGRVDPRGFIDDVNELNNIDNSKTVKVIREKLDISVEAVQAVSERTGRAPLSANERANAKVTIKNNANLRMDTDQRGGRASVEVKATLTLKQRSTVVCKGTKRTVLQLDPAEDKDVIVVLKDIDTDENCEVTDGRYNIEVVVDEDDVLMDRNKNNNDKRADFNVGPGAGTGCPDGSEVGLIINSNLYCDLDDEQKERKRARTNCRNNFECLSNACFDGACLPESSFDELRKLLCGLDIVTGVSCE